MSRESPSRDSAVPPPEAPRKRYLADFIFAPWLKDAADAPRSWEQDAHRAYVEQQPLRARTLLYIVALIVIALVAWAAFAEIDEVTRGEGKVIPSRQIQVMQSQDGGIVTEIHARAGGIVEAGQLLVRLDQTRSESNLRENQAEFQALSVRAARLNANLARAEFVVASGAVSQVEILRLEREVNQLSGEFEQSQAQIKRIASAIQEAQRRLSEMEVEYENKVREELTNTIARMNGLREAGLGLSDRVRQTEVRSPVRGTVNRLYHNTTGGVVTPGKEVVEVAPLDDSLLVEVRIRPKDIAFLIPGQEALVKLTAYDFVVYGGLEGTVEHIGADTIMDSEGNPFYEVHVRTKEAGFGEDTPIMPGMTVQVDILTGKKTILAYLMKHVLRAKQCALTER